MAPASDRLSSCSAIADEYANATGAACSLHDLSNQIHLGYFRSSEVLEASGDLHSACSAGMRRACSCNASCASRPAPTATLEHAPSPSAALVLLFSEPVLDTSGGFVNISRMQVAVRNHGQATQMSMRARLDLGVLSSYRLSAPALGSLSYQLELKWERQPHGAIRKCDRSRGLLALPSCLLVSPELLPRLLMSRA